MSCLMYEWPTWVRTGTPPCSRTTSGTAREQIRLCRIVAPGLVRSTAAASMRRGRRTAAARCPARRRRRRGRRRRRTRGRGRTPPVTHAGPQVALVGRLQRIGRVVRERAVELAVHHLELDLRQPLEHGRHDEAAHAVGGVGDDAHRRASRRRRRTTARGRRTATITERCDSEPARGGRRRAAAVEHVGGDRLDLGEPAVDADRAGARQAQLDAVVLRPGCARR